MTDIADFETTVLPLEDFHKIMRAAHSGAVDMTPPNQAGEHRVRASAMVYLEEIAKDPAKGSKAWQKAVAGTAIAAAAAPAVTGGLTATAFAAGFPFLLAATGPFAPFAAIGLGIGSALLAKNRVCTLLVANATKGDLIKDEIYIYAGVQTGRPVIEEVNEDTGRTTATSPDTIPGIEAFDAEPQFDLPAMTLGGLGLYRFEKDLSLVIGFYGTAGAISFISSDPKTRGKKYALAWLVPESGNPAYAVTGDLDGKYDSLEAFYRQTAHVRKSDNLDRGLHRRRIATTIRASLIHRAYPDTSDENDLLITAAMS
ncbi:MAG: hypothetical protein AAGI92_04290 [Pseudomonadota bacterium]